MPFTAQQRAFLDEARYAVVGTLNADGSIQQTVVWFLREGEQLRFSAGAGSVKAANLRRRSTITLTAVDGRRYLTISGEATIEPADADLRLHLAARYLGPDRAPEWVRRRPEAARISVRLTAWRVYGQGL
jgi:PPOX class probable F420-dependent enzyme